jgi:hypothetical protein
VQGNEVLPTVGLIRIGLMARLGERIGIKSAAVLRVHLCDLAVGRTRA